MTTAWSEVGDLLRRRSFRRLFSIRIAGQFGDGVLQAALASYVFFSPERHTSAAAAAAAFAVLLLPYSVIGPFAGVLLDLWQRRQVLFAANTARAALTVAVALQVGDGNVGVPFFGTVLVLLSVNRFVLAGLTASVPRVVSRPELVVANSVLPTSGAVAMIAGIGAGYLTQRWVFGSEAEDTPEGAVVMAAAVLYLLAGLLPLRLGRTSLGPDVVMERTALAGEARAVAVGMVHGARHLVSRRRALWALSVVASSRFFYGLTLIAAILLSRNYLHDPADAEAGLGTLAVFLGLSGAGFMAAAVLTPIATRRMPKEAWAAALLLLAAVAVLVPGSAFTAGALAVVATTLGVAMQGVKIVVDTIIHETVDDAFRGRVFTFYDVAFNASFVAAAAVAALFLPDTGRSSAMLAIVAAGFAVTAVVYHAGAGRGS